VRAQQSGRWEEVARRPNSTSVEVRAEHEKPAGVEGKKSFLIFPGLHQPAHQKIFLNHPENCMDVKSNENQYPQVLPHVDTPGVTCQTPVPKEQQSTGC